MDQLVVQNPQTKAVFSMSQLKTGLNHASLNTDQQKFLTILWNRGKEQEIVIDEVSFVFPANHIIALMSSQYFVLKEQNDLTVWQFNREFYCIVDHDQEVSCAGLLFYGSADQPLVRLSNEEVAKLDLLHNVFLDEFDEPDAMQEEMLRMLLKRLIIKLTRLYKRQNQQEKLSTTELDLFRQFNVLVEINYKKWHQVQEYADELNKSPKTLSNLFTKNNQPSPLKIIHERVVLEAKRMLIYTEFSIKEIAFELGFDEISPFNRIFKKVVGLTPSNFRDSVKKKLSGKID